MLEPVDGWIPDRYLSRWICVGGYRHMSGKTAGKFHRQLGLRYLQICELGVGRVCWDLAVLGVRRCVGREDL